jgi:hypothetical protein
MLEVLDSLIEGIKKELKKKVDKTAIAQAQERQLELKRAALRCVVAVGTISGAESNAKYKGLFIFLSEMARGFRRSLSSAEMIDSVINASQLKEQYDLILRQEQESDQ